MRLVLLIWERHTVLLLALILITTFNQDFKDWFQRNFLSILRNTESNYGHLWWHKYVLYCWLLAATTFSIVFATLIKQSAHKARFSTAYIRRENTHNSEVEMGHLFHILCFKDSNLLQRVGIFRVQPGIFEVGLFKNTREFGEL